MKTFSKAEMLALWRRRLGFDERRNDCTVEVYDGREVNDIITDAMRSWYLRLLDSAPLRLLPAARISCTAAPAGIHTMSISLPESCRRVTAVEAPRWDFPAVPDSSGRAQEAISLAAGPFGGPSDARPVVADDGSRTLLAAPLDAGDAFTVTGISDPGDAVYILDESLLDTIPSSIPPL